MRRTGRWSAPFGEGAEARALRVGYSLGVRLHYLAFGLLAVVTGCTAGALESVRDFDAGSQEVANDCAADGGDGGIPCLAGESDPCAALVARTCEPSCQDSPACAAAELTRDYEPDSCQAALDDPLTFPTCTASPCETLVERTCGGSEPTPTCADSPGCPPSLVLRGRATDAAASSEEIADALAACEQALEDATVFAACP